MSKKEIEETTEVEENAKEETTEVEENAKEITTEVEENAKEITTEVEETKANFDFMKKIEMIKNNKESSMLVFAGVVALLAIIIFANTMGNFPNGVTEKYLQAYLNCDGKGVVALMDSSIVDFTIAQADATLSNFEDTCTKAITFYINDVAKVLETTPEKFSKKVVGQYETIVEEFTEREYEDLKNQYEYYTEKIIEDAMQVTFQLDVGTTQIPRNTASFVKIDGEWYVDPIKMNFFMSYVQ